MYIEAIMTHIITPWVAVIENNLLDAAYEVVTWKAAMMGCVRLSCLGAIRSDPRFNSGTLSFIVSALVADAIKLGRTECAVTSHQGTQRILDLPRDPFDREQDKTPAKWIQSINVYAVSCMTYYSDARPFLDTS